LKNEEVRIRRTYESRIATNKVLPARRGGFLASCLSLLFCCISALGSFCSQRRQAAKESNRSLSLASCLLLLASCLPAEAGTFISPNSSYPLFKKNSCDIHDKGVTNPSKKNSESSFHSIPIEKKMLF
jgi:hypothetical protein